MSRVLCRRGLASGSVSRPFYPADLIDALKGNEKESVYVELDSEGWLRAAGAGAGAGAGRGAARAAACARLAPHAPARGAELCAGGAGGAGGAALRLRVLADLPPHAELLLWFDEAALAALDMPFLTLKNIRGRRDYACHECGAGFDEPNPLKLHLFLSCEPFEPARFWRRAAERLRARRSWEPPPAARLPLPPARLEALAADWGRSRDGHLCLYCGKLYSRRYGLKIHIRTHTGYRPLRCRYCARAFGDPSNLNKHVRLHAAAGAAAGAARHACGVCGRALARRRDLERHARSHAPAAPPPPPPPPPTPLAPTPGTK